MAQIDNNGINKNRGGLALYIKHALASRRYEGNTLECVGERLQMPRTFGSVWRNVNLRWKIYKLLSPLAATFHWLAWSTLYFEWMDAQLLGD